jgi:tetratricopeptide (TPR) repeat protein
MKKSTLFLFLLFSLAGSNMLPAQALKTAEEYLNRGIAYYEKDAFDKAITDYTQALKLDPNNVWAKEGLKAAQEKR